MTWVLMVTRVKTACETRRMADSDLPLTACHQYLDTRMPAGRRLARLDGWPPLNYKRRQYDTVKSIGATCLNIEIITVRRASMK